MTSAQWRPAGGFLRRSAAACLLLVVAMAPAGGAAPAARPVLAIDPVSGTPGTVVTMRGTGFCGAAACSAVRVTFAGTPVADGVDVAADGSFRGSFKVPGGGVPGLQHVVAAQTLADGNESSASAQFDLVFGKGEAAERQAQINDLQGKNPDALASEAPPRGVPLSSFAGGPRAQAGSPTPSDGRVEFSPQPVRRKGRSGPPWVLMATVALVAVGGGAAVGKLVHRNRESS